MGEISGFSYGFGSRWYMRRHRKHNIYVWMGETRCRLGPGPPPHRSRGTSPKSLPLSSPLASWFLISSSGILPYISLFYFTSTLPVFYTNSSICGVCYSSNATFISKSNYKMTYRQIFNNSKVFLKFLFSKFSVTKIFSLP